MAKEIEETKALATQDPFAGVPALDDNDLNDFASTGNMGDNDFEQTDITYGWLKIAQTNSQVATKGHAKYIPGIEAGMYYDTLTNTIFGEKIKLIYLKFFRSYTEYKGKKGDGEFIRSLTRPQFKELLDAGEIVLVEGEGLKVPEFDDHFVQEYANWMVMVEDHPEVGILRYQVGMGSIRQVKVWNTQIDTAVLPGGRPAPKWAYIWELELALDSDGNNHSYWNFGVGNKANVKRLDIVLQPLRSRVIKNFTFFQKTSVETVDNAGQKTYTDDSYESDEPV